MGWFILVSAVLIYYYGYYSYLNTFWSFPNKKASTITIVEMPKPAMEVTVNSLYEILALYQNPEKLIFRKAEKISSESFISHNIFYIGSWQKLSDLKSLIPDSIVSFNNKNKTLRWKQIGGYYQLPLIQNYNSMTYGLVVRRTHVNETQSLFFLQFDDANQILFLEQLQKKETVKRLSEKLKISDYKTPFVALYKVPKIKSTEKEIELLDGYILTP